MKILIATLLVTFAFLAPTASARHYSDFYVIPVSAHASGANGTFWMSDVAIYNFQTTPLSLQFVFVESGEASSDNVVALTPKGAGSDGALDVAPNGSVLLKDILDQHRGLTRITGSILVGGDGPFAVTSRTYSRSPSGDTVGQTVTPSADFLDNSIGSTDLTMASAYVPGLVSNEEFRTNIGFVAANASSSGERMIIEITLRNAAGAVIGRPRGFSIPSGKLTHLQFSSNAISDRPFDIGSATFRITEGSGAVVPYASVIDNRTADAVFVQGHFPPNQTSPTATSAAESGAFRLLFTSVLLQD